MEGAAMPVALVETKFFLPHARDGLLPRPRLERALACAALG